MFDGGRDALRDRWDASERDSELLLLAAGDDLGDGSDDSNAKRFDAAAAAILYRQQVQGGNMSAPAALPASVSAVLAI